MSNGNINILKIIKQKSRETFVEMPHVKVMNNERKRHIKKRTRDFLKELDD